MRGRIRICRCEGIDQEDIGIEEMGVRVLRHEALRIHYEAFGAQQTILKSGFEGQQNQRESMVCTVRRGTSRDTQAQAMASVSSERH